MSEKATSPGGFDHAAAVSASRLSATAMFRAPVSRRGAGVGAFVLAVVTAGALAHVAVRLKGLEVAYDLGRERRIAGELDEQRRRLQIEIGMLKDPRRVISIAREKLHMGPPAPEDIWRLGGGRRLERQKEARLTATTGAAGAPTPRPRTRHAGKQASAETAVGTPAKPSASDR